MRGALVLLTAAGTQKEGGDVDNEPGPLQGETIDWCPWNLSAGSGAIGVVLRVTRAVASVPQRAEAWFAPVIETAKQEGETVESVKLSGAECRLFGKIKNVGPVKNPTGCLAAGKGHALAIEINTAASTPVPAAVAQGLLAKAMARLP